MLPLGIEGSDVSDEPQNPSSELTGVCGQLFDDDETTATEYSVGVCRFGGHSSLERVDGGRRDR